MSFRGGGRGGHFGSGGSRGGGGRNGGFGDNNNESNQATSTQVVTATSSTLVTSVITSVSIQTPSTEEGPTTTEEPLNSSQPLNSSSESSISSSTTFSSDTVIKTTSISDSFTSQLATSTAEISSSIPSATTELSFSTGPSFPSDTASAMSTSTDLPVVGTTSTLNVTKIGLIVGGSVFGTLILGFIIWFAFSRCRGRRPAIIFPFTAEKPVISPPRPSSLFTFNSRSVAAVNRLTMRSEYVLRTPSTSHPRSEYISRTSFIPQPQASPLPTEGSPDRRVSDEDDTLRGDLQEFYAVDDWDERRAMEPARLSGTSMEMDPQLEHQFAALDRDLRMDQ